MVLYFYSKILLVQKGVNKIKITVKTPENSFERFYKEPVLLRSVLSDCKVTSSYPCSGKGICRKCAVQAVGCLSDIKETEKHLPENFRLSCSTLAMGDTVITISDKGNIEGVTDLFLPDIKYDKKQGFGTVTDIGTTTVATYLFDLESGKCINSLCRENPQIKYGADVISRIDFARKSGNDILMTEIVKAVDEMTNSLGTNISESVILGNTTMLHFYKGYSTDKMAAFPFTPSELFGKQIGNTYFPKCISPFIGADVVCGMLAADIRSHNTALLLDIGTNCETVLWHNGRAFCCSSAAGPAFEGANISCGVASVKGAIDRVYIQDGHVEFTTIGNEKPYGLCGSGLIDAASCMLKTDFMDTTGYIERDYPIGDSGYALTQNDIRQLQMAKAAVRAGIDALLCRADTSISSIEKIYLAGGFGSRIDIHSCEKIGLLPCGISEKTISLGNAAAAGGAIMLMKIDERRKSETVADKAVFLSLADDNTFSDSFIKYLSF